MVQAATANVQTISKTMVEAMGQKMGRENSIHDESQWREFERSTQSENRRENIDFEDSLFDE